MTTYNRYESPLGEIHISGDGEQIHRLSLPEQRQLTEERAGADHSQLAPTHYLNAIEQLKAYFAGELKDFELPLQPQGTEFQRDVWQALVAVQWGKICSYSDIANTINRPKAVRAVGAANGRNPIPIIIPCHRVIGSNGTLTGYYGGVHIKQALLAIEGHTQYQPSLL